MYVQQIVGAVMIVCAGAAAATAQSFDQDFLRTMRAHHQMGLSMARAVEDKVQHQELKKSVRKMIDELQKELAQITELLGDPDKRSAVTGATRPMGAPIEPSKDRMPSNVMGLALEGKMDMAKLQEAGEPDRPFIEMMIPHHAGAVLMSQDAVRRAQAKDVKAFAHKLLDAQAKEIGELHDMHAKWYGKL